MIYLDNHATTQCDPRVLNAMMPFFLQKYANPSSQIHHMGREASQAIEKARSQVAHLIGSEPEEILFTSSATESNNLVILGLAKENNKGLKNLLCSSIEHKSILAPYSFLKKEGYSPIVLPVDELGRLKEDSLSTYMNEETLLVSIQYANNEIGTIQNIPYLSQLVHEQGLLLHCDAVQAAGKIPIDVVKWDIDFLSISSHKMYGPKGIAALYIKGGVKNSLLKPILYGGEQESGLHPGTLNVPSIVGFGEACNIASKEMQIDATRLSNLRNFLEFELKKNIPNIKINGDITNRLPNNSNITFPGKDAETLILSMPDFAISTGSACNSGAQEPSYVLNAIGLSHDEANCTIRVGLGRFNNQDEITTFIKTVIDKLRVSL